MLASFRQKVTRVIGAQPFQLLILLAYYSAFIGLGVGGSVIGPTLPSLAALTGTRIGALGIIFFLRSMGYMIGTVTLARLVDRIKIHPLMGAVTIAAGLLIFFIPGFSSLWIMGGIFLLIGLMDSVISVAANTGIVWMFKDRSDPVITGLHFSFGVGAFLGPVIVAQLLEKANGLNWVFGIVAAYYLVVGAGMFLLADSPTPTESHQEARLATTRSDYYLVAITAIFLFFYVGAEISFSGWFFTFLTTLNLVGEQTAAYMNSAFWFAFTAGRLLTILLTMRFKPPVILPVALTGCLITAILLLVLPLQPGTLWAITLALGFFMAPIFTGGFTWASQTLRLTGRLTGIIFMGDSMGAMILPWLTGRIIDATSPRALPPAFLVIVLLNLISFFLMSGLIRKRKSTELVKSV